MYVHFLGAKCAIVTKRQILTIAAIVTNEYMSLFHDIIFLNDLFPSKIYVF